MPLSLMVTQKKRTVAVKGESYKDATIHIHELVTDDDVLVQDCVFDNCTLIGPSVIFLAEFTTIKDPTFLPVASVDDALIEITLGRRVAGVVLFKSCAFRGCRFKQISVIGDRDQLDRILDLFKGR